MPVMSPYPHREPVVHATDTLEVVGIGASAAPFGFETVEILRDGQPIVVTHEQYAERIIEALRIAAAA